MRIEALHHVQLAMPAGGEERAREFYTGVLGIPERPKPPELAERGGCWFEDGPVRIHLGVEPSFAPARKAHPALVVDDPDELRARFLVAGIPIVEDRALPGLDRFSVSDPFENRIEFVAPSSREQFPSPTATSSEVA